MDFAGAKAFILEKLERELNPDLFYHSLEHTLDVLNAADHIALNENVEGHDLILLKCAAIFHDSGMLLTYVGHEEASAEIVQEVLPRFEFEQKDIDAISSMIISTKLPQDASTFLEKILCDADLDYLGRDDFFMIAQRLRYEWNMLDINKLSLLEWYKLQEEFLETHEYFTNYTINLRKEKKQQNLMEVKELLR